VVVVLLPQVAQVHGCAFSLKVAATVAAAYLLSAIRQALMVAAAAVLVMVMQVQPKTAARA
jgi:hypothetical protein